MNKFEMRKLLTNLNCETRRYACIAVNDRECELCTPNEIEDEYHLDITGFISLNG